MKNKLPIAVSLAAILAMLVTSVALAAVWTDQQDYSPGSIVTIRGDNSDGAGYLTGETVHVDVIGPNDYTATCEGIADENGMWSCHVTLWDSELAGGDYTYTAMGLMSNVSQSGTFSDAVLHLDSVINPIRPTPDFVRPGTTLTWSATANCYGPIESCIAVPDTYRIDLLEFNGSSCSGISTVVSSGSGSSTGNLTFSAPIMPGTYSFRVRHSVQTINGNVWLPYTVPQCARVTVAPITPPVISDLMLGNASSVACLDGNSVTLDFSFIDPGSYGRDVPWHVVIDWGDGSKDEYDTERPGAQPQASHFYAAGTYTVSVYVSDTWGDTGSNTSAIGAVSLLYNTSGILQPINLINARSSFKLGSTVPVKVHVTDCNDEPVNGIVLTVHLEKLDSTAIAVNELVSASAADFGTTMRFTDSTDSRYIFNMSTKGSQFNAGQDLTAGSYHLWITGASIPQVDAYFDVRE